MRNLSRILILIAFLFTSVYATNGYLRHGYGVKYSSLGGAGTALSLSSLGITINPASLGFQSNRFDFNAAVFSPGRQFTITGTPSGYPGTFGLTPGTVESSSDYFVMPTIGAAFELNKNVNLGITFYGNGGMNTDYETAVFHDPSSKSTGVNLEQMFLAATIAYKLNENHSVGVALIGAYQRFSAKGLMSFANFSQDATKLSGNAVDNGTGFGLRVGYLGKIIPKFSFGVSYQTKFNMSEFDRYAGLYAEKGGFDIPSTWNVGIATSALNNFVIALDYQRINYSEVKSIANKFNPMTLSPVTPNNDPNPMFKPLGSTEGSGFGWEDMDVIKFGVMYKGIKDWEFMAGFSYGENPIKANEVMFNILAPGVMEQHFTLGASKKLGCGKEINFSLMYAPENSVKGANQFEAPGAQQIEISMSQWQFELGFSI